MLKAFGKIAIVIDKRGVIFQYAALYLEIVDAAGERIGKRFEDKERKRLAIIVLALEAVAFAAGLFEVDLGVLCRGRGYGGEERGQAGGGRILECGSARDG